ncbi:hypothetical protein SAMN04488038_11731 [Solimonas aquatica]|uniref:CopL family metal-binding regulatory protein n=1 Tax=Solimonas aquatica TaxID=489703 RepID=A0A1H9LSF9_9GAMM|nr:hypothetical protein [Solimonas aquatica]SER14364.1 hypothetical protein SAMN04488038_11731 [Solimonas aquatica]
MKWLATLTLLWLALLPFQAQAGSAMPCHEHTVSSAPQTQAPAQVSADTQQHCPHHGGARCHCVQACGAAGAALLVGLPALAFAPAPDAPSALRALALPRNSAAPPLRPPIATL